MITNITIVLQETKYINTQNRRSYPASKRVIV